MTAQGHADERGPSATLPAGAQPPNPLDPTWQPPAPPAGQVFAPPAAPAAPQPPHAGTPGAPPAAQVPGALGAPGAPGHVAPPAGHVMAPAAAAPSNPPGQMMAPPPAAQRMAPPPGPGMAPPANNLMPPPPPGYGSAPAGPNGAPNGAATAPGMAPPAPAGVPGGMSTFAPPLPTDAAGAQQAQAQKQGEQQAERAAKGGRAQIEEDARIEGIFLNDLLVRVLDSKGSDLHLTAGARPTIRVNGHLHPLDEYPILTPPMLQKMLYAILTQKQRERFEEELELDFAYAVPGKARFRTNVYRQRDALGAAFRLIPFEIKPLEHLGIPPAASNFAMLPRGFVLVTGPTGSGKSTTLASLIDLANRQRRDHIMTVEDPIEFLHRHQSCLVNQREVGEDTHSFQQALKHVLRQDPDIILVGEMRDLETISVALTAAETGHLVFATLHTQDAAQTVDRIIDVFPPHQQQQIRVQLAGSIQGVVAQQLCRTADGRGRVVCAEVLVATPAVRNLIREGKTHQIYSAMQAGGKFGMQTMDQHLAELVRTGRITYETGMEKCHHVEDFNRLCGRA